MLKLCVLAARALRHMPPLTNDDENGKKSYHFMRRTMPMRLSYLRRLSSIKEKKRNVCILNKLVFLKRQRVFMISIKNSTVIYYDQQVNVQRRLICKTRPNTDFSTSFRDDAMGTVNRTIRKKHCHFFLLSKLLFTPHFK